jgi:hypothetical protein
LNSDIKSAIFSLGELDLLIEGQGGGGVGDAVGGAGAVGALGVEADLGVGVSFVGTVDQRCSLICSISLRNAAFSASSSSYVGFFLDIM